jgi:hypothetical protein
MVAKDLRQETTFFIGTFSDGKDFELKIGKVSKIQIQKEFAYIFSLNLDRWQNLNK